MFMAASETTQKTTQTILSCLSKYPEILGRVREEFEEKAQEKIKKRPELANLSKRDLLE